MKLEHQLDVLADAGLHLANGVTVDDLLYSFERGAYEERPFDLILFMFGSEVERAPEGRWICDRGWNFDTECVYQSGAYVNIVQHLLRIAGTPDRLTDVRDHIDFETGEAWLEYTCDGRRQRWDVEVNGDWADLMVVTYVADEIERDGRKFYYKDNGQAMVFFYLDAAAVARVNELSSNALEPFVVE